MGSVYQGTARHVLVPFAVGHKGAAHDRWRAIFTHSDKSPPFAKINSCHSRREHSNLSCADCDNTCNNSCLRRALTTDPHGVGIPSLCSVKKTWADQRTTTSAATNIDWPLSVHAFICQMLPACAFGDDNSMKYTKHVCVFSPLSSVRCVFSKCD